MYLGIDFGLRRIGLAIGSVIPKSLPTVEHRGDLKPVIERISQIVKDEEVEKIILGFPLRSQGEPGTLAKEIVSFGRKLGEVTNLPVFFEPEEFTSVEAALCLNGREKGKGKIDELAAIIILEQFINREKDNAKPWRTLEQFDE